MFIVTEIFIRDRDRNLLDQGSSLILEGKEGQHPGALLKSRLSDNEIIDATLSGIS